MKKFIHLFLSIVLVFYCACGKKAEKAERINKESEVPVDFPKDIPVYPEASNYELKRDTEYCQLLSRSKDPVQKIGEYFKNYFESHGWQVKTDNFLIGMNIFATKGSRDLRIMVTDAGEARMIMHLVLMKK